MFNGGNPFDDDTTVKRTLRPRFKFVAWHGDAAEIDIEMVDAEGNLVFTTSREFITPGGSITLTNIVIEMFIKEKP